MLPALAALVVSFGTSGLIQPLLRSIGLVDVPNHRSSHSETTLLGGGVAVLITVTLVFSVASFFLDTPVTGELVVIATAGLLGLTGLVDDLRSLPVTLRIAIQAAVSLILALLILNYMNQPLWLALVVIPVGVVVVNAVNFMDGVNGISALHGIILGATVCFAGVAADHLAVAVLGAVVAAAFLGFLPWNFPRAKMFLGDVGSYFLGGLFLGAGVLVWLATGSILLAVSPIATYLADVFSTLLIRFRRGASLTEAHSDHCYQAIRRTTGSHVLATAYTSLATTLTVLLAAANYAGHLNLLVAAGLIGVVVITYLVVGLTLGTPHTLSRREEPACA